MAAPPYWWPLSVVREGDKALGLMGRAGHTYVALTPLFEVYFVPGLGTTRGRATSGCARWVGCEGCLGAEVLL